MAHSESSAKLLIPVCVNKNAKESMNFLLNEGISRKLFILYSICIKVQEEKALQLNFT